MTLFEQPRPKFTGNMDNFYRLIHWEIDCDTQCYWEQEYVFFLCRAGHGLMKMDGKSYQVGPNWFCQINRFNIYNFLVDDGEKLLIDVLVVPGALTTYMDSLPENSVFTSVDRKKMVQCCVLKGSNLETISSAYTEYEEQAQNPGPTSKYLMACIAQRIQYIFWFCVLPEQNIESDEDDSLGSSILKHIFFCEPQNLNIQSVAEHFGIDQRQLNMELQKICGTNFSYVQQLSAVTKAKDFLLRDIPTRVIAAYCGFQSQSSFFRTFRSITGYSPEEYRVMLKEVTGGTKQLPLLVEIQNYVMENFKMTVTINDCAKELYISPYRINKTIQEFYGNDTGFHETISGMRLVYARSLLISTKMLVTDIAFYSGYNSVHSFIRQFKEAYSITPKKFQMEMQKRE